MSAANDAVRALQRVTNRYSQLANFTPIAVDGGMGGNTERAVGQALFIAAANGFDDLQSAFAAVPSGQPTQLFIMQHIADITTTLAGVANSLGLPAEIKPSPVTSLVSTVTNAVTGGGVLPSDTSSLTSVLSTMTPPMKLALGGMVVGIGYLLFVDKKRRRR